MDAVKNQLPYDSKDQARSVFTSLKDTITSCVGTTSERLNFAQMGGVPRGNFGGEEGGHEMMGAGEGEGYGTKENGAVAAFDIAEGGVPDDSTGEVKPRISEWQAGWNVTNAIQVSLVKILVSITFFIQASFLISHFLI